ncbi:spore coat protein [Cytobacillus purgationiresistens]|uniref:Spore coat protein CotF n=1 Tax=Cytobacillus purgationiresistens TaxID=863449 RepID=A0ABU0APT9_9BACI|nr:spore coat protein [Cytobacillus purgationiresistens]MDQ0272869.1 spore coat protein CotF [Cytobacillus purgationiresistens]
MPNNIEGRGLTDREMVQLCLELEKGRSRSVSNSLLETSHQGLRDIYQHCFQTAADNQYTLFEMMAKKGWYQTNVASPAEMTKVLESMQNNLNPSSPE